MKKTWRLATLHTFILCLLSSIYDYHNNAELTVLFITNLPSFVSNNRSFITTITIYCLHDSFSNTRIRNRQMYSRVFDWSTKKGKSRPSLGQLRSGRAICYELYQAGNECYSRSSELVRSKQSCLMILLLSLNSDWISVSFLIVWLNLLFKAFL